MQFRKKFGISIIAHRGYRQKYPENTLLSFSKAIEAKADYIEFDVHLTADKEIVVCHDRLTGRTGNQNYVIRESILEKLKTVDMGQGQRIPTLQEVIDLCKGKIGLQIEIKHTGIAEIIVPLIEKNNIVEDTLFSSFWHNELGRIKAFNPKMNCGVLEPTPYSAILATFNRSYFIHDAKKVKADAIHPFSKFVNKKFCKKAHDHNYLINVWTVDDPKEWNRVIEAGVDGILTNAPESLYNMLSQTQQHTNSLFF